MSRNDEFNPDAPNVIAVPVYHGKMPEDFEYMGDRVYDLLDQNDGFTKMGVEVEFFETTSSKSVIPPSVRGKRVFIVHPYHRPHHTHLMTAVEIANSAKLSKAKEVVLIEPYNKAWRQDKRRRRESMGARIAAEMYQNSGINDVITFDPHVDQIVMAFSHESPIEPLHLGYRLADFIKELGIVPIDNITTVSPDVGAVKNAMKIAKGLASPLVIYNKVRNDKGEKEGSELFVPYGGKDIVQGRVGLLPDDVIVSGGSITDAGRDLIEKGMTGFVCCATHLDLTDAAYEKLEGIQVVGTNSIPGRYQDMDNFHIMKIEPIIAKIIEAYSKDESISSFFNE